MTEAEWLDCPDPQQMLKFLRGRTSERKLRLAACACCRYIWHLLVDERSRKAVEVAERYAEGQADRQELDLAFEVGFNAAIDVPIGEFWEMASKAVQMRADAAGAAFASTCGVNDWNFWESFRWVVDASGEHTANSYQAVLLTDIFGNPFRDIAVNSTWLTPAVLALAEAVYDNRSLPTGLLANNLFGVLADALEEAGCDNADILTHCRGPTPHVRGCWVIDLILAKR